MRCAWLLVCASLLGCRARGDGKEENALREAFMKSEMNERGGLGAWEISQQSDVRLGPEWCAMEPGLSKGRFTFAHRWMGQFGSVRLSADGSLDMVLHLLGVVPIATLRGASAFHVRSGGTHLDTFHAKADDDKLEHDVVIDRATIDKLRRGAYLYVDIEATSPRAGERGCTAYAFALQRISWKPVGAAPDPL